MRLQQDGSPVVLPGDQVFLAGVRECRCAWRVYLEKAVQADLRPKYQHLFERYDYGAAELMFVTNHRINEAHFEQVRMYRSRFFTWMI